MCLTIQGNSPISTKDPPVILTPAPLYQRAVRLEYNLQAIRIEFIKIIKSEIIYRNGEILSSHSPSEAVFLYSRVAENYNRLVIKSV